MSPSTAGLRLYKFATFLIRHLYDLMNRDNALTAVFHSQVMPLAHHRKSVRHGTTSKRLSTANANQSKFVRTSVSPRPTDVLFLAMSDAIRGSLSFQRMVFTCMNGFPHGHPQAGCVAALQQHVPCLWYG